MQHRFCLVAPGDYPSTHKVSEALVLGGAGGCIPVFVVPGRRRDGIGKRIARWLPYSRWLDYCTVGYLVEEASAQQHFKLVLQKLKAVGEAEAEAKLRALHQVRAAFVFPQHSSIDRPAAPHYILNEACHAARRFAANETGPELVAGGEHSRCMLD